MKKPFLTIGRVVLTLLIVTFAVVLVWRMVMYYMFAPWTRDGHIRADIIQMALVMYLYIYIRTHPGMPNFVLIVILDANCHQPVAKVLRFGPERIVENHGILSIRSVCNKV